VTAREKLNIDTPEQVALEFSLATVGSRFLALAIDTLIQVAVAAVLLLIALLLAWISSVTIAAAESWVLAGLVLGMFTIYYGYFAVLEVAWNGQTPGKRIIGLRVMHVSGRPISGFEAILRNVVRIVDQMPGIYAIGIVSVFITERSQRLGDLAAGTVVVHERTAARDPDQFARPLPRQGVTTAHGAARLTADEIAVIELFFRRQAQLDGYPRIAAAKQIASRVRHRLGITSTIGDQELLAEILAEYHAQTRFR
jgi:uncharacterized RDD family membrane protein YckC